jgi:DNA integrity scanning protein DisA with diadenylate cyclase activity
MTIIAASVYYSPTLKALRGKFGARHRAALGISEITDAITVVVSEETGRISIAKNGEIIVINRDNFAEVLAENLSQG